VKDLQQFGANYSNKLSAPDSFTPSTPHTHHRLRRPLLHPRYRQPD